MIQTMRKLFFYNILLAASALWCTVSCTDELTERLDVDQSAGNIIQVATLDLGGPDVVVSAPTRADGQATDGARYPAEYFQWLIRPLKQGLHITYGYAESDITHQRVAELKLLGGTLDDYVYQKHEQSGYAYYTFKYIDNPTITGDPASGSDARWYGNGQHYFRGLNVPEKLKQSNAPADLVVDQHDDRASDDGTADGNYTLLERYLGMPATTMLTATVSRVLLPFRHRLSRVIAYVLIDPEMGENVTLRGFKKDAGGNTVDKEDPTTTDLRFCNVQVLKQVNGSGDNLQPEWATARKAIPHFLGMRGSYKSSDVPFNDAVKSNFIVYTKLSDKTKIYPANEGWKEAHEAYTANSAESGYSRMEYGEVPCYDLIVRPTYTSASQVMYDETFFGNSTETNRIVTAKNKIDFELTLSNELIYQKTFEFDLDANYETIVYLCIDREGVDFNTSGAEMWDGEARSDNYYGVNNSNGNTLSEAGSSWQRAYRAITINQSVTDGHYYDYDTEDDGQYLGSDEKWIEFFSQAHEGEGGTHHGDYFILDHDITIPAAKLPANFVFTGHLDAQDHTITISGRTALFDGMNADYSTKQESTNVENWEANVHKEGSYWVPFKGWRAEVLNTKVTGGKLFGTTSYTGNVQNCFDKDGRVADHTPALPQY